MPDSSASGNPARALDGIRVIDLTRHMSGPYGTTMLADHGADVIKVEGLPAGDPARNIGTAFVNGESGLFLMWNHGKRSVAIDLHTADGVALVRRLAREADVFVENYRPGVAAEIGLGYDELAALNPRLVYCSVSAFGQTGPLAPNPGTDPVVQALSGVMSVTGEPDGEPSLVGVPVADFTGAMALVQAVLLGLLVRERTGRGQRVEVSMLAALMYSLTTRLATYWTTGEEPARHGSAHSVVAPYGAFQTSDGWVMAGAWAADGWPRFCRALGLTDLIDDPRFDTNPKRVRHREQLDALVKPVFRSATTARWQERFARERALFGPINTVGQAVGDPAAAGFTSWVEHPRAGRIPQPSPPLRMSATPPRVSGPPPLLGEHTAEVLAEAGGLSAGEIDDLVRRGVVAAARDGKDLP